MIKTKEKTIEWLKGFDELLGSGEHNNHDGIRSAIYHLENSIPMDAEVKVNFAEVLDDMIKELQTEQQTIQNANNDDDWEKCCWDVCDHQLKILYQLRSKISA